VTDPLLVVGGDADFNLGSLLARLDERGCPHRAIAVGATGNPSVVWDLQRDLLTVDGQEVRASGAFVRHDVFTHLADRRPATAQRASSWHATLAGWLFAHPRVRMLNRGAGAPSIKPFHLVLARQAGLEIPYTLVTNDRARLAEEAAARKMIAKPVPGGGYCQPLEEALAAAPERDGRTASPAIVQNRLVPPEVRVYSVGGRFIPFKVRSTALDYRTSQETTVEAMELGALQPGIADGLGRLMEALGMDYGAADFKTDPDTGRLIFLELNSSPMFAAFDAASGHAVSDAIIDFLLARGS
jgi:hypothetical protein